MNLRIILGIFIAISVLTSCTKDDKIEFDRTDMTAQLVENVILPRHLQLQQVADSLYQVTEQFHGQPTLAHFQVVTQQWNRTKAAYKLTEVFNFGAIRETVVHNKMNKWPVNTSFIDGFIADSVAIDQPYVDGKGSTAKGLAAIEYLLFDSEGTESEMYQTFVSGSDAQRRIDLLLAYTEDLYFKAYFLNDLWVPTGDNYGNVLVQSSPVSGLESPIGMLVNEMIARVERIVHAELGAPLGNDNGGVIDVTDAEAFRSANSLACVRAGVVSLRETFLGTTDGLNASASLKQHLIACGAEATASDIETKLDDALVKMDALGMSLEESLTQQPQQLEAIRAELQEVIVLFKTEVVSTLSITLTFNDNDGD